MRIVICLVLCMLMKVSWAQKPQEQYVWLQQLENFKIDTENPTTEHDPCNMGGTPMWSEMGVYKYGFKMGEMRNIGIEPKLLTCPHPSGKGCKVDPGAKVSLLEPIFTAVTAVGTHTVEYGRDYRYYRGDSYQPCSPFVKTESGWHPISTVTISVTDSRIGWKKNKKNEYIKKEYVCKSDRTDYNVTSWVDNQTFPVIFGGRPLKVFINGDEIKDGLFRASDSKYGVGKHRIKVVKSYDNGDDVLEYDIEVCTSPTFTGDLADVQYVCPKGSLTLHCPPVTGGGTLSYSWRCNDDNYKKEKSTDKNYTFDTTGLDKKKYKVFVQNQCSEKINPNDTTSTSKKIEIVSKATTIAVYGKPSISNLSSSSEGLCPSGHVVFSITAAADDGSNNYHSAGNFSTLTYEWWLNKNEKLKKNDTLGNGKKLDKNDSSIWNRLSMADNISSYTYQIPSSAPYGNGYKIKCVVSDGCTDSGKKTNADSSAVKTIKVLTKIKIRTQPLDQNVCGNGDEATFSIEARANRGTLRYQWQKREKGTETVFQDIPLEESSSYKVLSDTSDKGNQYRCVLTDDCGESTRTVSGVGKLSIISDSIKIRTQPVNQSACGAGDDVTFSIEAQANQGTLTYQWQKRRKGKSNDTDFRNITLQNNSSYTVRSNTSDNGNQYRCVLTDNCGKSTQTKSGFGTLNILESISCTKDPTNATSCEYTEATLGANFSSDTVQYKWYYNPQLSADLDRFTLVNNATAKDLTIDRVLPGQAGYYYCEASNKCYSTRSTPALLTVHTNVQILIPPTDHRSCIGDDVIFRVSAGGTPPYTYKWYKYSAVSSNNSTRVGGDENSLSIRALALTHNHTKYRVGVSNRCSKSKDLFSDTVRLSVNAKPKAPEVLDVTICDAGNISSQVTNPLTNENYRWYSKDNLTTPVYEGKSPYTLTLAKGEVRDFKVFKVVNSCVSSDFAFTTVKSAVSRVVNLGEDLSLCHEASPYDLSDDIGDDDAKGGIFEWRYNNAGKSGNRFNPKEYKRLLDKRDKFTFVISYTPPDAGLSAPYCFQKTEKNVSIVKVVPVGSVKFIPPVDSIDKAITLCINTGKEDLSTWVDKSQQGGRWGYGKSGKRGGLTGGGTQWYYEPNSVNYGEDNYNALVYTVRFLGCYIVDTVRVYVKNNLFIPVISGNVERVCQDEKFTLIASVANNSGLSYVYSKVNDDLSETELSRQNPDLFQVSVDTKFSAYTIDEFKCNSAKAYITVKTPFGKGQIQSDRSTVDVGEAIKFSFDGVTAASYLWDFGDKGLVGRVRNPIKYYFTPGTFNTALTVIGTNGSFRNCPPETFTFPPIVVNGLVQTIYTHGREDNGNSLFPNPVSSVLICQGQWIKNATFVSILSMDGRTRKLPLTNGCVEVSDLSAGIYCIICNNVSFRFTKN